MAILTCKGLSKRFGGTQALDQVDITIEPGRIVGLLGPNGSGKTTLIKLANGLLTPSEGEIRVCGLVPGKESHACVSYLPERTAIPTWMSVTQLLDFYQDFYADVERLLYAGADKVSVNSAALRNPKLIEDIANRFCSQVCVCAIDARCHKFVVFRPHRRKHLFNLRRI